LALLPVVVLVFVAAGCKQGLGDRCEQPSDCASGMCSSMSVAAGGGTGRCIESGSTTGMGTGGAGGSGGTSGGDGAAGSDGAQSDAEADGMAEAGTDAAPGGDASSDAVDDGAAGDGG
jgi:hypothetical protein